MAASDARNRLIRRVHVEARNRGIGSDDRKAMQLRVTGKESCADMNEAELRQVVAAMTGGASQRDRVPEGAIGAKLTALWISAWHLGMTRDRSDAALAAFVRRQTGLSSASWLTPAKATQCVDALKDWMAREAGVNWQSVIVMDENGKRRQVDNPRARILEAQWRRLHHRGVVHVVDEAAIGAYAGLILGTSRRYNHRTMSAQDADRMIRHFGGLIRGAPGAADAPGPSGGVPRAFERDAHTRPRGRS